MGNLFVLAAMDDSLYQRRNKNTVDLIQIFVFQIY